jgi:hypothetical protein
MYVCKPIYVCTDVYVLLFVMECVLMFIMYPITRNVCAYVLMYVRVYLYVCTANIAYVI